MFNHTENKLLYPGQRLAPTANTEYIERQLSTGLQSRQSRHALLAPVTGMLIALLLLQTNIHTVFSIVNICDSACLGDVCPSNVCVSGANGPQ
jgi:hypothetical protein